MFHEDVVFFSMFFLYKQGLRNWGGRSRRPPPHFFQNGKGDCLEWKCPPFQVDLVFWVQAYLTLCQELIWNVLGVLENHLKAFNLIYLQNWQSRRTSSWISDKYPPLLRFGTSPVAPFSWSTYKDLCRLATHSWTWGLSVGFQTLAKCSQLSQKHHWLTRQLFPLTVHPARAEVSFW